jgi:hypothetical protein
MRIVILHLLKRQFPPERRSRSWGVSIRTHRNTLEDIFQQSPSLKRNAREALTKEYEDAAGRAMIETGLARKCFPAACPYTFEQVTGLDFLPGSR